MKTEQIRLLELNAVHQHILQYLSDISMIN